jgi:hypothetical protein
MTRGRQRFRRQKTKRRAYSPLAAGFSQAKFGKLSERHFMRSLVWIGLAGAVILSGCATAPPTRTRAATVSPPRSATTRAVEQAHNVTILLTNMAPARTKRIFDAPLNSVWRAALDATQQGDLEILSADRTRGYISVRNSARVDTTGEHLGVSVRSLGPTGTEVEVLSRQTGGASFKNWENEIIRTVAANLARENGAAGSTGAGAQVYNEIHIDRDSATIVPETREQLTEKLRVAQRRVAELRERQRAHESELRPETSEDRREELRTEIDRLREELRIQEERLRELEKDRR